MLLFALLACDGHSHGDAAGDDTGWVEATAQETDDGAFYLMYSPDPYPIPFNEPFSTFWMVHDGEDHGLMYDDATLTLAVTMPGHGHGMNTEPQLTADEMGNIQADGFLFHMRGWWAIEATATRDGVTDSTTFYVNCCEE